MKMYYTGKYPSDHDYPLHTPMIVACVMNSGRLAAPRTHELYYSHKYIRIPPRKLCKCRKTGRVRREK